MLNLPDVTFPDDVCLSRLALQQPKPFASSVLFHSLRLLAGKSPKVDFPPGKGDCPCVNVHEMVVEMKLLERRLTLYEEKYGVLSEDFYAALMSGKLARYDAFDETRADFSRWKGIYETWRRRKAAYDQQVKTQGFEETLRFQPAY